MRAAAVAPCPLASWQFLFLPAHFTIHQPPLQVQPVLYAQKAPLPQSLLLLQLNIPLQKLLHPHRAFPLALTKQKQLLLLLLAQLGKFGLLQVPPPVGQCLFVLARANPGTAEARATPVTVPATRRMAVR